MIVCVCREATENDLPDIHKISEKLDVTNRAQLDNGFLVSGYSPADLRRFYDHSEASILVADVDGVVVGYLTAYTPGYDSGRPGSVSDGIIESNLWQLENPTTIKQVGVLPGFQRKGVASELFDAFMADQHGHVFATIVNDPPNPASEALHSKYGFCPFQSSVSQSTVNSNLFKSTLWCRDP